MFPKFGDQSRLESTILSDIFAPSYRYAVLRSFGLRKLPFERLQGTLGSVPAFPPIGGTLPPKVDESSASLRGFRIGDSQQQKVKRPRNAKRP